LFIDHAVIKVISGKGGDGAGTFRREKYVPKGGPDGGDGGGGADVILLADKHLTTLVDLHHRKTYRADNGVKGRGSNMHGRNAEDLTVKVPVGTVVKEAATGKVIKDLVKHGQSITVAKGGRGGKGNARFKTSTRQAPRFFEKGEPGEEKDIILELKILADAGIIGMANAGKSTLLSKISKARPKIANYPFTTLAPVLGLVKISDEESFVVADIPGLIEGASEGKGLGIEFLKHIERTRIYIHIVDPTQGDAIKNYRTINRELGEYNKKLLKRPQVIGINKADLLKEEEISKIKKVFKSRKLDFVLISARENIGLEKLVKKVYNKLKKLPKKIEEEEPGITEIKDVISLKKVKNGVYKINSVRVEKYTAMLDFENSETIEMFRKYLKKEGIEEFLRKEGVKEGDIVIIGDREFVYEED